MAKSQPFESFGKQLKKIRQDGKKSLLELSGAVELDPELMRRIESGAERPTEELIVLVISHFDLQDEQALELWKLAGFDKPHTDIEESTAAEGVPTPVVVPLNDARVVYTDMVNVSANNYGVVINFLQGLGANNQPMAVSRVGMSIEHAVSFMKVLSDTVEQVLDQQDKKKAKDNKATSEKEAKD